MAGSKIMATAHALPEKVVTNDDLAALMDTSDEWIFSRTGIKERRIAVGQDTSDLATEVAQKLLNQTGLSAGDLDFILVATITPDSLMPSTAARVQAGVGAKQAFAMDLVAACSGFVYALSLADKLLHSGKYQYGLVIGAEVFSKVLDWEDRSTAVLFGDGAGGVLVQGVEEETILAEKLESDGSRGDSLTLASPAYDSPFSSAPTSQGAYLTMVGREIFNFAVRDVPKNMEQVLRASGKEGNQVDYYLLHQANSRILDSIAKKTKIDRQKFLQNMAHYGNTSAASIPILLSESVDTGTIKLNGSQTVMMTGFGGGLTWGSLIIHL